MSEMLPTPPNPLCRRATTATLACVIGTVALLGCGGDKVTDDARANARTLLTVEPPDGWTTWYEAPLDNQTIDDVDGVEVLFEGSSDSLTGALVVWRSPDAVTDDDIDAVCADRNALLTSAAEGLGVELVESDLDLDVCRSAVASPVMQLMPMSSSATVIDGQRWWTSSASIRDSSGAGVVVALRASGDEGLSSG
jgi:hypothetical protein